MAIEVSSTLPFQQMIEKAEAELRSLNQTRTEMQAQLSAIEAESHRLAAQRNQRAVEASKVAQTIEHLGDTLARLYAAERLGEGTLALSVDVQIEEARERMAQAVSDEQHMRERHAQAELAETGLVDQAEGQSLSLHTRLRQIELDIKSVAHVRDDAMRQQQLATLNDILRQREGMQSRIDELERQASQEKERLNQLLRDGLMQLQDADLRAQIAGICTIEDPTVHVLTSAYQLLDVIISQGTGVEKDKLPLGNIGEILADMMYNIVPSLYNNVQPGTIDRKNRIAGLLAGYIEARRRQL